MVSQSLDIENGSGDGQPAGKSPNLNCYDFSRPWETYKRAICTWCRGAEEKLYPMYRTDWRRNYWERRDMYWKVSVRVTFN